jgi:hypothetical protein
MSTPNSQEQSDYVREFFVTVTKPRHETKENDHTATTSHETEDAIDAPLIKVEGKNVPVTNVTMTTQSPRKKCHVTKEVEHERQVQQLNPINLTPLDFKPRMTDPKTYHINIKTMHKTIRILLGKTLVSSFL